MIWGEHLLNNLHQAEQVSCISSSSYYKPDLSRSLPCAPDKIRFYQIFLTPVQTRATHFATLTFSYADRIIVHAKTVALSILHLGARKSPTAAVEGGFFNALNSTNGIFVLLTIYFFEKLLKFWIIFKGFLLLASTEKERHNSIIT